MAIHIYIVLLLSYIILLERFVISEEIVCLLESDDWAIEVI